ncbi:MAG: glucose 1-dehydrogenase [Actinomycetota bacterium]|jgi:NAD(P)-dependent dehydrogenase (short-subunit alcohol dehydrogenase family)|nr:glucose 1-dehydrogenase [Actinomycetota bacterium]MDA3015162.1 glucose 1-dehydrogenase [Actinomycetota bacterium]MDA3027400.1 glucose 1-dehydrogenase [Actinomycetota bacterium]
MADKDGVSTRVVVVTGGGGGIGRAAVERYLAEGWSVVAGDLNGDRGRQLIAELDAGDRLEFLEVDVAEEVDVEALVTLAVERFGGLDVMFNNAGIGGAFGPITEQTVDEWDATFAVNMRSVFLGTKHAAKAMIAGSRGGAIVNTASVAGLTGGGGPQAYSATKSGVISLTMSTAVELAEHRIRVNAICPGAIYTDLLHRGKPERTDSWRAEIQPWPDRGDATAIADIAYWLGSDESRFVTGTWVVADGGLLAATPRLMAHDLQHMRSMAGIAWGNTGRQPEVRRFADENPGV